MGRHAYRLRLPPSIKRHQGIHLSEIEAASNDPPPRQRHTPPPPVVVDGEGEWEVEEVVDSSRCYRELEYKVEWMGDEETTWQLAGDLQHAADMVELFHQKYPDKPRPEKK